MSYEGYEQLLCEDGHYWTVDAYETYGGFTDWTSQDNIDDNDNPYKCPICGKIAVWMNGVDTTNGSFDENNERIDGRVDLEVAVPASYEECPTCHHKELVTHETYKIPNDKGHMLNK